MVTLADVCNTLKFSFIVILLSSYDIIGIIVIDHLLENVWYSSGCNIKGFFFSSNIQPITNSKSESTLAVLSSNLNNWIFYA